MHTPARWHPIWPIAMKTKLQPKSKGVWGIEQFQFIENKETQAFVMSTDKLVLVAFRGTESNKIKDWVTDLKMKLIAGHFNGKVHHGFNSGLDLVWAQVKETISKLVFPEKSLWFTGHSLGAALAALDLRSDYKRCGVF
jgi:triacylglycerol lipase